MLQNATYLSHNANIVRQAWLNSSLVWLPFTTFWTYPSKTTTITNFNVTTTFGNVLVDWGDGTDNQTINSNTNTNRTFTQPTTSISIAPPVFITNINCGTSSPRLSGSINLTNFPNITGFTCNSNDITSIFGYQNNTKLRTIAFSSNKITGSIPSLSANTDLVTYNCRSNLLTGSIPPLSGNRNLQFFYCHFNQLTGVIPNLNSNVQLEDFYCHENDLTGNIPNLNENLNLVEFYCHGNRLESHIPTLSSNTKLTVFHCYNNRLTQFAGGSIPDTLGNFQAQNNTLSRNAVDAILSAFSATTRTVGTRILYLGGASNSIPSFTGGVITGSPGSNFSRVGTTVTANVPNHNHPNGSIVTISNTIQPEFRGTFIVTVINANQFQYTTVTSGSLTGTGFANMRRTTVSTDGFRYYQNLALVSRLGGYPWDVTINFPTP